MLDFWLPEVRSARKLTKDTDVLVVALVTADGEDELIGLPDEIGAAFREALGLSVLAAAKNLGAKSEIGSITVLQAAKKLRVVITGMGNDDDDADEIARRAAGAALRHICSLAGKKPLNVSIGFADVLDTIEPAVEGALLGCYRYKPFTTPPIAGIRVITDDSPATITPFLELAVIRARGICLARHWTNAPANRLYPESFATEIAKHAKAAGVEFEIWDAERLAAEGYGGIVAVGQGSANEPRLIKLHYLPKELPQSDLPLLHLALVGKGITFDSGGLDLKPPDSMYTMKHDMAGAAAVMAAILAAAQYQPDIEITAWAALAENMPSGSASHPSDVLTMYSGKTVENGNTDAEGRLVLADALARAVEDGPNLVIDLATLTGACVVALGERTAGYVTNSQGLSELLDISSDIAGEYLWQLPIPHETRKKLESKVADLKSTGNRYGGALSAAAFLYEFVPDDIPWAHLDIAGPAFNSGEPYDHIPSESTGFGVLTLIQLIAILESLGDLDDDPEQFLAE
ncbi:MAG: leucyl aminopeptidase, partial [Propionibacteriaceae bacterium]|nr:leucyl aminopeptidase [Propionibacteriaceae bacterium]